MLLSQSNCLCPARAPSILSQNAVGRSCMGQNCRLLPYRFPHGRDTDRIVRTCSDPSVFKLSSAKTALKWKLQTHNARPICSVSEATETSVLEAASKEHLFQAWNVENASGLKGQKRTDLKKILVLGAGPIVIGQACEFDYSGTQACKALKEEGYEVVLVNSNPATIMTDPEIADYTYITPMTPELVEIIIEKERPDAVLPTMGGQTALNLTVALSERGVLEKYGIELIGAKLDSIKKAVDRDLFKQAMNRIGVKSPPSGIATTLEECFQIAETIGEFPLIIRPAFTLGGTRGGIAYNKEEFEAICKTGLAASVCSQVSVEKSLLGWKEYELEVMRDLADNVVIICSIENIDPMGVHTGDSITVAPAQTLTDKEYQRLRDQAVAIMREIGVECGGSNVQFAVNPKDGEVMVIEMNPRVSRSSALASKATGFPIAKMAAKLSVGYTLDLIPNDITKKTPASFEPSIDYVVTKDTAKGVSSKVTEDCCSTDTEKATDVVSLIDSPTKATNRVIAFASAAAAVGLFLATRGGFSGATLGDLAAMALPYEEALSNGRPTVVEFYADWCEVCREMAPDIYKVEQQYKDVVNFVMVNVDNTKWEQELDEFGVEGIPHFAFLDKKGNEEGNIVGRLPKKFLEDNVLALSKGADELPHSRVVGQFSNPESHHASHMADPRSHGT